MGLTLENIVPWGRSFAEYQRMFALDTTDLGKRILGCGDGPAAFNAELTVRGGRVVSVDPLYAFDSTQIHDRIEATRDTVLAQMRASQAGYVWQDIPSVEALGQLRMAAMQDFLADFAAGQRAGRYINAELPALPFADGQFELALCSHLLFLYSKQLAADFHLQAIRELLRVAREVRIFPLLTLDGTPSPHLQPVCQALRDSGCRLEIVTVDYEFQRGGNRMLVIHAR